MNQLAIILIGALGSAALALWRRPQIPRFWPLLVIAAVPQLGNLLGVRVTGMLFIAIAAIGIWCLANRSVRGALIVAAGAGLNLLVMAFHGGSMPIRADVVAAIGYVAAPGAALIDSKDVVVHSSALWLLSDWIVVPLGSTSMAISPGDMLVVAGIVWWLLFSHQLEKDQSNVDALHQASHGRAAHAPVAGTE